MRSNIFKFEMFLLCLLFISISSSGQIKLPKLISDGMVLQRDADVKIWGWAAKNEPVTVQFLDSTYHTVTDTLGTWTVHLVRLSAGGPFIMTLIASDTILIRDIMV